MSPALFRVLITQYGIGKKIPALSAGGGVFARLAWLQGAWVGIGPHGELLEVCEGGGGFKDSIFFTYIYGPGLSGPPQNDKRYTAVGRDCFFLCVFFIEGLAWPVIFLTRKRGFWPERVVLCFRVGRCWGIFSGKGGVVLSEYFPPFFPYVSLSYLLVSIF